MPCSMQFCSSKKKAIEYLCENGASESGKVYFPQKNKNCWCPCKRFVLKNNLGYKINGNWQLNYIDREHVAFFFDNHIPGVFKITFSAGFESLILPSSTFKTESNQEKYLFQLDASERVSTHLGEFDSITKIQYGTLEYRNQREHEIASYEFYFRLSDYLKKKDLFDYQFGNNKNLEDIKTNKLNFSFESDTTYIDNSTLFIPISQNKSIEKDEIFYWPNSCNIDANSIISPFNYWSYSMARALKKRLEDLYSKDGLKVKIIYWKSNIENASYNPKTKTVTIYGGLLKNINLWIEGLSIIAAHEFGHFYAGPRTGTLTASEREADHWSTLVGNRQFWDELYVPATANGLNQLENLMKSKSKCTLSSHPSIDCRFKIIESGFKGELTIPTCK